jgi:hypothetical protein
MRPCRASSRAANLQAPTLRGKENTSFQTRSTETAERSSRNLEQRRYVRRIFGWDTDKPGVQLNQQFVISQEMIERIREAADADDLYKKPAISEGEKS